jgi:hypothetical protein
MRFKYTAFVDASRVRGSFESEVLAAAQLAGASDVEFHEDEEERKPAVSFVIDAATEHTALILGHEVMRSVIGGKLAEGVVRHVPGDSR